MKRKTENFYLVREDMLSEAMLKTVEAKKLIESGKVANVSEAAEVLDMSRSAFYKYKDGIFPFHTMVKEKIVTLSIHLEDRSGALSKLLAIIAEEKGNVLTINQTIPLQGRANLTVSIETASMTSNINRLVYRIETLEYIERVEVIGSGT
ncbi:ACT domain-containing protein [Alteribacter aurantiacus]|uniref:ACT domain-containing protein n=1 Tax=Alteribacter aurantiacus TaxID=254410 RepID=UPI0003F6D47E|nr:ACT domain-containing protein [Alteribacter aurantiacus]